MFLMEIPAGHPEPKETALDGEWFAPRFRETRADGVTVYEMHATGRQAPEDSFEDLNNLGV